MSFFQLFETKFSPEFTNTIRGITDPETIPGNEYGFDKAQANAFQNNYNNAQEYIDIMNGDAADALNKANVEDEFEYFQAHPPKEDFTSQQVDDSDFQDLLRQRTMDRYTSVVPEEEVREQPFDISRISTKNLTLDGNLTQDALALASSDPNKYRTLYAWGKYTGQIY